MASGEYQVREAVAVFHSEKDLQAALYDLLSHGFDRSEISLLANTEAVEKKLGHAYQSVSNLEDDPTAPTVAFVSNETRGEAEGAVIGGLMYLGVIAGIVPIVVSGGALATVLAAAPIGGGGGAAIGSLLGAIIEQSHADYIEKQLRKGGLVLWVRTWNAGDEARAVAILKEHSGEDVHLHGAPNAAPDTAERFLEGESQPVSETHNNETISQPKTGGAVAGGYLFASVGEAKAHLDRASYIAHVRQSAEASGLDLNSAFANPGRSFKSPEELLASPLPDLLKTNLLRRWAYDQKSLERASNEGMPENNGGDCLQEIKDALLKLGEQA